MPDDLESLTSALRTMSTTWPCAGQYLEILKLIIDTREDINGDEYLRTFSDTRRTSYGLQALLGPSALRRQADGMEMFEFFDLTFPHVNEGASFVEQTGQGDITQDWLV